jgi:hypothetical protein
MVEHACLELNKGGEEKHLAYGHLLEQSLLPIISCLERKQE